MDDLVFNQRRAAYSDTAAGRFDVPWISLVMDRDSRLLRTTLLDFMKNDTVPENVFEVAGEPLTTLSEAEARYQDFERLLVEGDLDWIQPDPGRCGITTLVEVGRLAHRLHKRVVNHSFKSGITIAASLHGLAAVPQGEVFEFCMSDSPLRHDLTHEVFAVEDGYIKVTDAPGLGVTINEETIQKYPVS